MSADDRTTALASLAASITELGDDEVRVLAEIARRLLLGQGVYGRLDLATDTRDMRREASEELLDGRAYLAATALRRAPATCETKPSQATSEHDEEVMNHGR